MWSKGIILAQGKEIVPLLAKVAFACMVSLQVFTASYHLIPSCTVNWSCLFSNHNKILSPTRMG